MWQLSPESGLQSAADHINDLASKHVPTNKPLVRLAKIDPMDVIRFERSVRRCSAKWVAHQVKEELKNED